MLIFTFSTIDICYATWKGHEIETGWFAKTLVTLDVVKWIILLGMLYHQFNKQ